MPIDVLFDHLQSRLAHDRIAVVAGGLELDGSYFADTYIDPVTNRLFLKPAPYYPEWFTLNTGNYAKLAPSDLTATTPGNWYTVEDYKYGLAAGPWIASKSFAPGGISTNTVWGVNRGFALSIFSYGAGDDFVLAEFGWNPTPNYLQSVGLRLYSGGDMEVWKDGTQVGLYNISGAISSDQKVNANIDLLLIPMARRELLVLSRQGNGFSHVFEDIDEDEATPIITPAAKFYVSFPSAGAQLQLAPLKYATSGYATSEQFEFGEPPEVGDTLETFTNESGFSGTGKIYGDLAYAGTTAAVVSLVSGTNGTFTPNGVNKECRIKVAITGDGNYTPFVYAAQVAYAARFEDTDDTEEASIMQYAEEIGLDIPDSPSQVSARVQLIGPETIEATDVANLKRIGNRPVKIKNGSIVWMDALGLGPSWEMSTSDATQRLTLEFRDQWKSLENYRFKTRMPLDGYNLVDAIKFLLGRVGITSANWDLEALDFDIEPTPSKKAGEYNVVIEIGDTAAEWIQRLIEDYAATYHYGFEPTASGIKFVFKSPYTLEQTDPEFELWPSIEGAIAGGILAVDAWKHVYRSYDEETLECEANDIRVTGWNPRLRKVIQSHKADTNSIDPTAVPSARPDNWVGEPRLYGLVNAGITNQATCDDATNIIYDRLTPIRVIAEIECEMMVKGDGVPIWRGKRVNLHGKGIYQVVSLGVDFVKEQNGGDTWQWRPAKYCLERKVAE